jgi:hypothetical protein
MVYSAAKSCAAAAETPGSDGRAGAVADAVTDAGAVCRDSAQGAATLTPVPVDMHLQSADHHKRFAEIARSREGGRAPGPAYFLGVKV